MEEGNSNPGRRTSMCRECARKHLEKKASVERAKGDMLVLSPEKKVIPDHAQLSGNFKGFVFVLMMRTH